MTDTFPVTNSKDGDQNNYWSENTDSSIFVSTSSNAPTFINEVNSNDVPLGTQKKAGVMSHFFHGISGFFARHKTYTAFLLVMVSSVVFYTYFSTPKDERETLLVSTGSIHQFVKVTGQVEATKDANLSFQVGGQVSFVGVKVGDAVTQDKVLANLSAGDAQANVLQAQANVSSALAILSQLQQGARKEEIAFKEQLVENAKSTLDQSYYALPDTIQNVDATTADVVKNKFSSMFAQSNGKYTVTFSSCDQRLQSEIERKRTSLEDTLADFQTKSSVITAISSTKTIDTTFESAYQAAVLTNDLVNSISNLLLAQCSITNPYLDGFRASLSGVKITMTALFSDITAKRNALLAAKNNLNQASRDLDVTQAGTDPFKIKAQKAVVEQARAQLATAQSGLAKTILRAPFAGTINSLSISEGEIAIAGRTAINILATDGYEIEAKVPEADIPKIKLGSPVEVTLDAYGKGIIFPATITRINPGATNEGSVPIYKVIITFTGKDERVKQGMTANIQVLTENKSQVIAIPSRFVKVINGEVGTVQIMSNGIESSRDVQLGIRGAEGLIEIRSGLSDGEIVVVPSTGTRGSQKQTTGK